MNNSCSLLVYRWPQPETIHRPHIWNSIRSWGWENGTDEIPTANGIVPRNLARNNVRKYMWHVVQALKSASFCVYVWAQRATKCRENSIHRVHCTHVNDPTYYRTQPNCIFMPLNISLTERAKCKTSYFRFSWVGTIPFEFGYCYARWCRSIAASKYAWIICSTEYCIIWASSTLPSILRFLWLWYATITGCSIWMHTKWDSNPMLYTLSVISFWFCSFGIQFKLVSLFKVSKLAAEAHFIFDVLIHSIRSWNIDENRVESI